MVSKQTIRIMIEAEEKLSKVAQKAEKSLDKLKNAGKKSMDAINKASSKTQNMMSKMSSYVDKARNKFNELKNSGQGAGSIIKQSISNAANSFGKLLNSSNLASRAMEKIKSVSDGITGKISNLKNKIVNFGSSAKSSLTNAFNVNNIKAKLSSVGTSIDKVKAKLKTLSAEAKKAGGSGGLGFLRNAASMTVGMLGYDLVGSFMESARASINARSSMQAFATRLKMSGKEVTAYQKSLDNLQGEFKKIDMDVVGQQATDLAYRLGLPKTSLTELTETTAIFTDAMQRNDRSAEDAMLAMSDAMDGQFRRLQEIGIGREDLMKDGWSGDISDKTGLLKAMNKALKEQHYDVLAKSVDTLDGAWQVLSITIGNLIESILVQLTPTILGIIDVALAAVESVKGFLSTLSNMWNGLPDWAKYAIEIAAVAVAIGVVVSALGGVGGIIGSIGAAILPVIGIISGISLPLIAVVAGIGLLAAAVFEAGKAFSWWSDVGTMFEAIGDGVQKLWNAFINHPDVQAVIKTIGDVISWLGTQIGGAIQWVTQFLGITTGSEWDVVTSIIQTVGAAWDTLKCAVGWVVGVFTNIWNAFNTVMNILGPFGSALLVAAGPVGTLVAILRSVVCILLGCSPGIVPALQTTLTVFTTVWSTIASVASGLIGKIVAILSSLISKIVSTASKMISNGIKMGKGFVNGVINNVKQIPGKVYSYMTSTASRIVSGASSWASNASSKARGVYNAVKNGITGLPGTVYNEFMNIGKKIYSAGSSLANQAADAAKKIVDAFKNAAGIHSPGYIQRAMVGEFGDMVDRVGAYTKPARKVAGKVAKAMVAGFGDNTLETGVATDTTTGKIFNTSTGKYVESESSNSNMMEVLFGGKGELDLNFNLKGLPEGISTEEIIRIIREFFDDPDFKNALFTEIARSAVFQKQDNKEKQKMIAKNKRARGV